MNILREYINRLQDSSEEPEVTPIIGKHNHIPDEKFNSKELKMGISVESEHTNDTTIAKAIAKDHLSECANYYTRLAKMEKDCKS